MSVVLLREGSKANIERLTLNDPATRNSLSAAMIDALQGALAESKAKVIIIAANGPAFSSGHNLKEMTAHRSDPDQGAEYFNRLFDSCAALMLAISQHGAAVIAEVDGLASAAGCQLVASCDLAIASDRSTFCTPGVNIGLFCSTPMVALSRAVSHKHAMEMLLTGDLISAADAWRFGLVNRVASHNELKAATQELAEKIAANSAAAIRIGKREATAQLAMPVADAYAHMAAVMAGNMLEGDAKEGIAAFIQKRHPTWEM